MATAKLRKTWKNVNEAASAGNTKQYHFQTVSYPPLHVEIAHFQQRIDKNKLIPKMTKKHEELFKNRPQKTSK